MSRTNLDVSSPTSAVRAHHRRTSAAVPHHPHHHVHHVHRGDTYRAGHSASSLPMPGGGSIPPNVAAAAYRATSHYAGVLHKCYRTAALTAQYMGGNLSTARASTSARGLPISHLETSAAVGKLEPGMVIYANRRPGTDPDSVNLANKPHWFTYLGKDASGVMRFSDNFGSNYSLDEMEARYGHGRKIDTIFDPLATRRV